MTLRTALPTIVLAAVLEAAAAGQAQQAGTLAPAVEPAALEALANMGAYLQLLRSFEVRGETAIDVVLESGQKLQFECALHFRIHRPDRLWVEVALSRRTRQFFYDGRTLTIWDRATSSTPASLPFTQASLIEQAEELCGAILPMTNLFSWGVDPLRHETIREAIYVGPTSIKGDPCDQFAFREEGVDWQIWIQRGSAPLPRKLVITAMADDARPQYTTTIDWNLAPVLDAEMFAFDPPPDQIMILELTPQ